MSKKEELQKISREIKSCKKCDLWKTRKNTVPGEGPSWAKIMAIGQAPGAKEDETGRPFVGRSGKFLTELLKTGRIRRDRVFITSPLKCFPPGNRRPKEEEVEACRPYLEKQIKTINPKKIILLGQVPFSIFFPGKKIKDFRGKTIRDTGRKFFVSYHPAAGIRFQKMRKILERDFKKLRGF